MDPRRRAVITGVGLVCPLGADRESSWRAIVNAEGYSPRSQAGVSAPVPAEARPRTLGLALRAAEEAWRQAGFSEGAGGAGDPERVACVVSSSKPLLGGPGDCIAPEIVPTALARRYGVGGTVLNVAAACATGAQSLLLAAGWVQEGRAEVVLAGAAESSLHPLYLAGFGRMGVLSASGVTRPFDRDRDGFAVGEGAAVFVVEAADRARARGATVMGEVLGGDSSSDAHHLTRFNAQGETLARCLRRALSRAEVAPEALDYINAHGTATRLNDNLETKALLSLFPKGAPPISSTKGATGHLLGATGAVEIAFCLLALRDGVLPPTLHLQTPETDRLDFVPGRARRGLLRRVASLSFGFGGALAAVVLGAPEP